MTTNRKLTIGIIALLVINLIILSFLFMGHKKKNRQKNDKREGPMQIISKKLDFNDEQIASFKEIVKAHRENVQSKDKEIKQIKIAIFNSLGSDTPANIDSLTTRIGSIQSTIEAAHYNHFAAIKKLCTEDQLPKFTELSKELSKMFIGPKGRAHKREKNKK